MLPDFAEQSHFNNLSYEIATQVRAGDIFWHFRGLHKWTGERKDGITNDNVAQNAVKLQVAGIFLDSTDSRTI